MDKSFFESRHLPQPQQVYQPEDELMLKSMVQQAKNPLLILGGGLHAKASVWLDGRPFDVLDMSGLDQLHHLDHTSMIAHVGAGMRWGQLRDALNARNASLAMYGLFPQDATIGGLLARRAARARVLFDGDIRDGLISVDAWSASDVSYHCLPAPRKSSGPDFRHLFVGSQGAFGPILSARLMVWPRLQGHLFSIEASQLGDALEIWQHLLKMQMRFAFSWWDQRHERFLLAAYWPIGLDHVMVREMISRFYPTIDVQDHDALDAVRVAIESQHPATRTAPLASRTLEVSVSLSTLAEYQSKFEAHFDQLVLTHWTHHGALLYGVMAEGQAVPAWLKRVALEVRPVLGTPQDDWTKWDRNIKEELDAKRIFVVGL